jgi:hypothetical protein
VVKRDVRFEEEKDFRKSCDVLPTVGGHELVAPKEERVTGTGYRDRYKYMD